MSSNAQATGFFRGVDLDNVVPGNVFEATWVFKNEGTTTWDSRYKFVYTPQPHAETADYPRSPLGAPLAVPITEIGAPAAVNPGDNVQLTLTFTAPLEPGTYGTNWQLKAPDGQRFGPVRWLRAVVTENAPVTTDGGLAYQTVRFTNSVENFNNVQPGRRFLGKWVLRNTGTAAWMGDFAVAYFDQATAETSGLMRHQMGAPARRPLADFMTGDRVAPGETITIHFDLVAPQQAGGYAFHWLMQDSNGRSFGSLRWLQIGVVDNSVTPGPDPAASGAEFGVNISPNPGYSPGVSEDYLRRRSRAYDENQEYDLDLERLQGTRWVRFPYFASIERRTPEEAYHSRYRRVIQTYASRGIKSLIILLQDTGHHPVDRHATDSPRWEEYAEAFAQTCKQVAMACAEFGDMVAYQIWNEVDSGFKADADNPNHSAMGLPPKYYALLLGKAARAIREVDPQATIVLSGLKSGVVNGVEYLRRVQRELGDLPVDALACHPYGAAVDFTPFHYATFRRLPDALRLWREAFPDLPMWITEIGCVVPIGEQYYETVARYTKEVVNEVADNWSDYVEVLTWFKWKTNSPNLNAGIVDMNGRMKPHIADAYQLMLDHNRQLVADPGPGPADGQTSDAEYRHFQSSHSNLNVVPAGTTFSCQWTFENTGETTWGDGYRFVYAPAGSGNHHPMSEETEYALADVAADLPAAPGVEVRVRLEMKAPAQVGRFYTSRWELRDPDDRAFGHGYVTAGVVEPDRPGLVSDMAYIKDLTIGDGLSLVAGTDFNKQWLVRNSGRRHWGDSYRLVHIEGDVQMAYGKKAHMVPKAQPGEEIVLSIPMTTPPARNGQPTTYASQWRLQDDRGNIFGDPVWAKVIATDNAPSVPLAYLLDDPTMWYSQLDPRWANDELGYGTRPMRQWGCLLTCMAMAISAFGMRINPQGLNRYLTKPEMGSRGFTGSDVYFYAPYHVYKLTYDKNLKSWPGGNIPAAIDPAPDEDPIQRIDAALAAGNIVLAQVDTRPNDSFYNSRSEQHWVIIVKRTPAGDDYLILNPLVPADQTHNQPLSLMDKYGNRQSSRSNSENLRDAIKSSLVYSKQEGGGH